jgi:hypothetical protein
LRHHSPIKPDEDFRGAGKPAILASAMPGVCVTHPRIPILFHWATFGLTALYTSYAAFWGVAFLLARLRWAPDTQFWAGLSSYVTHIPVWQDIAYNLAVLLMALTAILVLRRHRAAIFLFAIAMVIERLDWALLPFSAVGYEASLGYGEMAVEATILLMISLTQHLTVTAKPTDGPTDWT